MDVLFSEIDVNWLRAYEMRLRSHQLANNTFRKYKVSKFCKKK
ncbi:hypothetical protein [Bacteroides eggerthii]|nr:hypothetical protein I6J51_01110 [Bacteroides eggerthii]